MQRATLLKRIDIMKETLSLVGAERWIWSHWQGREIYDAVFFSLN